MRSTLLTFSLLSHLAMGLSNEPNCTAFTATATDPMMQWHCQGPGETSCTNQHIACIPHQDSKGLVVFLPGTNLQPSDYSDTVAEMAYHGFHSLGLMYPSTQGQNSCDASRAKIPTDLNCTARERFKVKKPSIL